MAQRPTGPLIRVLIGDAQPRAAGGPHRTVPYKREVGLMAGDEVCRRSVTPPKTLVATRSTRGTEATGSPPPLRHAIDYAITMPAPLQIDIPVRDVFSNYGAISPTPTATKVLLHMSVSVPSPRSRTCCNICKEKKRRNPTDLFTGDPKSLTLVSRASI